jgi:hypothetical protein
VPLPILLDNLEVLVREKRDVDYPHEQSVKLLSYVVSSDETHTESYLKSVTIMS